MKECSECGNKGIWKCLDCDFYLCAEDRFNHSDIYSEHITKKAHKSLPGKKPQKLVSKLNLVNYQLQENIDSLLENRITAARNAAWLKLNQQRSELIHLLSLLNSELTEDQFKEAETKIQHLSSFCLVQNKPSARQIELWNSHQLLHETQMVPFKHTKDSEGFETSENSVSILNPAMPALASDIGLFNVKSMYKQREAMEKTEIWNASLKRSKDLTTAKELQPVVVAFEEQFVESKDLLEEKIKFLSSKISTKQMCEISSDFKEGILANPKTYMPPPNTLEAEFTRIYNMVLECIEINQSVNGKLLDFIKGTAIDDDIDKLNDTYYHTLYPKFEKCQASCDFFLGYIEQMVVDCLEDYVDFRVSNDNKFYFLCE